MADPEHLRILKQGVEAFNEWRGENPDIYPDLFKADLSGMNLNDAFLQKAELRKTNLVGANLQGAYLVEAELNGENLRKANLNDAILQRANLSGADLSESKLYGADLVDTTLRRAVLNGAELVFAVLSYADLSRAALVGTNLHGANLFKVNLREANLTKAILTRTSFVEAKLEGADLSYSSVYGISVWNLKTDKDTKQLGLVITDEDEPIINVDNIEIAHFIYLLLKHENLRQVLNSVTERGVLILGRFGGGGIEVLRAVAEKLREMKYLPIIFDFDRPRDRNYTETIKTLTGLSRFVIADLSGPSVPQELYATVPHFKIPFVPILENGKQPYAMFADILEYEWVMKPIVEFDNTESLIKKLPSKIIKPAEKRHEKRQKILNELFGK